MKQEVDTLLKQVTRSAKINGKTFADLRYLPAICSTDLVIDCKALFSFVCCIEIRVDLLDTLLPHHTTIMTEGSFSAPPQTHTFDGVLSDFDGTIVDSTDGALFYLPIV